MAKSKYLIACFVLLALAMPLPVQAVKVIGEITRLRGDAYIYRKDVSRPIKAALKIRYACMTG